MGMPGTLPTLNEKVVDYAIRMGHALNCEINRVCKQDRKNYFYPDLPKAYQISQAEVPLCGKGYVDILVVSQEYTLRRTQVSFSTLTSSMVYRLLTLTAAVFRLSR